MRGMSPSISVSKKLKTLRNLSISCKMLQVDYKMLPNSKHLSKRPRHLLLVQNSICVVDLDLLGTWVDAHIARTSAVHFNLFDMNLEHKFAATCPSLQISCVRGANFPQPAGQNESSSTDPSKMACHRMQHATLQEGCIQSRVTTCPHNSIAELQIS